jgi:nucleotide-binding universal stress UspA family protein
MDTLKTPSAVPEVGVRASLAAPIIIATDGQEQSDGALAMGRLLAESSEALRLVTVLRTLPMVPDVPMQIPMDVENARRADVRREVSAQADRVWGPDGAPTVDVELHEGDPATEIARLAHRTGASMIVAGLGRHRVTDRVFGDETALRLIRAADVPVYATAIGTTRVPRRIVVAMDFSETSLRAARLSLEVAGSGATIYLTHVAPRDSSFHDWKGWGTTYKVSIGDALARTHEQLRIPEGMTVQNVLLQGDVATELLAFAAGVNADLIATGSHGHGFVARMLVGSVATRLVRCSTCSVLTVPRAAVMTEAGVRIEAPVVRNVAHGEWSAQLDAFSRRNAGRRGTLEVDDPEIGAQAQEFDYPLRGATYDSHDQRVTLMFGEVAWGAPHLTRGIAGASALDILQDDRGRDLALRVAHGAGQTLLTFAS